MNFKINSTPTLLTGALAQVPRFKLPEIEQEDKPLATSYIGTPIYDTIVLSGENTELEGSELRIDTALMTVSRFKNIVRTPINGRDGTVKEYISADDYMIEINGYITGQQPNVYPVDDVTLLSRFIDLNSQIKVSSAFLNSIFGVSSIVIEEGAINQELGTRNQVPFTLRALSDEDIELQIGEDAYTT